MTFPGFEDPRQNWSKLPHAMIGALHIVETCAELKVILYVLRHTWGYHDDEKIISMDEFLSGRKDRRGGRIDGGLGMSENAIKDGIKRAIKHGFIKVETNAKDPARIRKSYSLTRVSDLEGLKLTPGGQLLTPRESETDPRTKKETIERDPEIETPGADAPNEDKPEKPSRKQNRRQEAVAALEEEFSTLTGLPLPARKTKQQQSAGSTRWWVPLGRLYDLVEKDIDRALELMHRAIAHMETEELTISAPQSIENVALSIYARQRVNGNGHGKSTSSGSTGTPDDQARLEAAVAAIQQRNRGGR